MAARLIHKRCLVPRGHVVLHHFAQRRLAGLHLRLRHLRVIRLTGNSIFHFALLLLPLNLAHVFLRLFFFQNHVQKVLVLFGFYWFSSGVHLSCIVVGKIGVVLVYDRFGFYQRFVRFNLFLWLRLGWLLLFYVH